MRGIIAAGSQQTAEAGAEVLRQGGNAVDAAVAAMFASFVAEAAISAFGGGGFGIVAGPDVAPRVHDFFCTVPGLGETPATPLDFLSKPVIYPDATNHYYVGRGSSAVPGNPAGLAHMLTEYGTLSLDEVLAPTIRLARDGFRLSAVQGYLWQLLQYIMSHEEDCKELFLPGGKLLVEGDVFRNESFARTMELLVDEGCQSCYSGPLAEALVNEHRENGGLISLADLAQYRVIEREPLHFEYKDYDIYTNPPPSSGGILIAYSLRLLEKADQSRQHPGGVEHLRLLTEIMRQTIIARGKDRPAEFTFSEQWNQWLEEANIAAGWKRVEQALALGKHSSVLDDPGGPSSTTHVSVIDENGLAVGITTTPGETAGYAVGDTGILMNNMLGEEDLNPDGFHQLPPGTRMSSMMAPSIVRNKAGAVLVLGSGGASRLRGAIFQLLNNILDWKMPLDEAVERGRIHFEHDILELEQGYDPAVADALEKQGYEVRRWRSKDMYFGGTHIALLKPDGSFEGAGDPRRGGAVIRVD